MRRVLFSRIFVGLVVAALIVLPIGSAMMPVAAMPAPDAMAHAMVQDHDSSCPDCCDGCPPAAMQSDACAAQCTAPVAIQASPITILEVGPARQVSQLPATRSGFTAAPTSPPPKSTL